MRKIELEKMLLDSEASKKLHKRAADLTQNYGESNFKPNSMIKFVEPLPHEELPTLEEVQINDFDNGERRLLLSDIGAYVPWIEKENPKSALKILTEQCRKNPSDRNQTLVVDAINRITSAGEMDVKSQEIVKSAIEFITAPHTSEEEKKPNMDAIYSWLYQHADYNGKMYFAFHNSAVGTGSIYGKVRSNSLRSANLHDCISSLRLDMSYGEVGGELFLFQHDRFFGRYTRYTARAAIPYVGNFINDKTSSILVVRRFNNEVGPLPLDQTTGIKGSISALVSAMDKIDHLRGDPVITWDMWPEGGKRHPYDPTKKFIQIKVPVEIDVPNWFNYDAEIWIWIYLYISGGKLKGRIDWFGAWVEGGIITNKVLNGLMNSIPNNFGAITALINSKIELVEPYGPFERLYYLPGTAGNKGYTNDDVSIVLAKT